MNISEQNSVKSRDEQIYTTTSMQRFIGLQDET